MEKKPREPHNKCNTKKCTETKRTLSRIIIIKKQPKQRNAIKPTKLEIESMATATKKSKLRTAGDVLSRIRWESVDVLESSVTTAGNRASGESEIILGYIDRIEGPMEKNVKDYVSAKHGIGDLPEHRIQYFRRNTLDSAGIDSIPSAEVETAILWDRNGRVDKIFGSGNGSDARVADETVQTVRTAVANMIRIE